MKKYLLFLVSLIMAIQCFSQVLNGINYQGIVRNQLLVPLNKDSIQLRFTILDGNINGDTLYTETRGSRTDSFGVFNVVIGGEGAISNSGNFKLLPWSNGNKKFLRVELNQLSSNDTGVESGFGVMGTTEMLSVPYSYHAAYANSSGKYFFSSTRESGSFQNLSSNPTLIFPTAIINEGNVYNAQTGEFHAPEDGFYCFNVNLNLDYVISCPRDCSSSFGLSKNGKIIRELDTFESHSVSVNLWLKKDDTISVKMIYGDRLTFGFDPADGDSEWKAYFAGMDDTGLSEFSGYKIR